MPDKWEQYAQKPAPAEDKWAQYTDAGGGQGTSPNYGPGVQTVNPTLGQIGKGALREGANLLSGGYSFGRKALELIPGVKGSDFDQSMNQNQATLDRLAAPQNMGEAMGKAGGEMASYLIPAKAETAAVGAAPEMLRPIARIATGALSGGAMSSMNRHSFASGAVPAAVLGGVGEGLRSLAPKLAESAVGITKADRAFGRTPGNSILDETRGIRPGTIAETGQARLNELTPELESRVDAASIRANRLRGLLQAPKTEVPLHETAGAAPKNLPMSFRADYQNAPSDINPDIESPHYLSGSEHPELSGRVPVPHGVMLQSPNTSGGPIPTILPNPTASLAPARGAVNRAIGTAGQQEASSLHGQLSELRDFLHRGAVSGEEIPENVTPRRLLDLKRGFSKEFLGRWNPETHGDTIGAGRSAYRAMDQELDRTVPEAAPLNQRISSLIPVVRRAESTSRNAPIAQKVVGRFIAPTGALTLAGMGAAEGATHGGLPGAIAGGLGGLVGPLVAGTPEGQMIAARALYSPATSRTMRAVGIPATQKLIDYLRTQRTDTGGQQR